MRIAGKEFAKAQRFAVRHRPTRTNYAHIEVSVPVNKSPDDLEALGKLLCAAWRTDAEARDAHEGCRQCPRTSGQY
jgi:hypothetical protein